MGNKKATTKKSPAQSKTTAADSASTVSLADMIRAEAEGDIADANTALECLDRHDVKAAVRALAKGSKARAMRAIKDLDENAA